MKDMLTEAQANRSIVPLLRTAGDRLIVDAGLPGHEVGLLLEDL